MNNKKILVVGVLAVIVTMMVGYALFSETITINGTATAKGDFDITPSCMAGLPSDSAYNSAKTYFEGLGYIEGGYSNDTCQVNGNTVSFGANFKYPGAARYFTVTFKNTGSIPATADAVMPEDTITSGRWCIDNNGDDVAETCDTEVGAGYINRIYAYGIKENETIIDMMDESADISEFYDASGNLILKPGNSVSIIYVYYWDKDYDDSSYNGKLFSYEYTMKYNFTQKTN